jgi:hypothetical protein
MRQETSAVGVSTLAATNSITKVTALVSDYDE